MLVAILRDMRDACLGHLAHRRAEQLLPVDAYRAAACLAHAGDRFDKLRLAVAVDACDAIDLAGADLEADVVDDCLAVLALDRKAVHLENRLARLGLLLVHLEVDRASDHHFGQLALARVLDRDRADDLAAANDRAGVGDRHDLLELMGNKDD